MDIWNSYIDDVNLDVICAEMGEKDLSQYVDCIPQSMRYLWKRDEHDLKFEDKLSFREGGL